MAQAMAGNSGAGWPRSRRAAPAAVPRWKCGRTAAGMGSAGCLNRGRPPAGYSCRQRGQGHDRWRRVRHRPRGRLAIMRRNCGHRLRDCHYGAHTKRLRRATITHLYGCKLLLVQVIVTLGNSGLLGPRYVLTSGSLRDLALFVTKPGPVSGSGPGAAAFRGSRNSCSVTAFSRSWREPIAGRRPGRPLWVRRKGWPAAPGRLPLPHGKPAIPDRLSAATPPPAGPGPVRYRPRSRRCRMSPAAPQRASRSAPSGLGGGTRVPAARGPSRRRRTALGKIINPAVTVGQPGRSPD
jgi:hypothetical protein